MKILLVSQYFWPENFIINELVQCLVQQGNEIEVLTTKPNYPQGIVYDGYKAKGCTQEMYFNESVPVYRVPIRPRGKGGGKNLLLNYLSFVYNGCRFFPKKVKGKNYDFILVFAPSPITSVLPAIYLRKKLKTHLAVWVQDLWPESLQATGYLHSKMALSVVRKVVKWIYSRSDTLLVQSPAFADSMSKICMENKIIYYPNSYLMRNEAKTEKTHGDISLELKDHLLSTFSLVFAGNLGHAQSLNTILGAAERLRDHPSITFVIFGDGCMLQWLTEEKDKRGLENILLAGRYPAQAMPVIFSCASALMVTLAKSEIFSYTIPSKVQAYLAAGRPILAALDGEGARIIDTLGAGLTSPAEDIEALVANIISLYNMSSETRDAMGENGKKGFHQQFDMIKQSKKLIEILSDRLTNTEELI